MTVLAPIDTFDSFVATQISPRLGDRARRLAIPAAVIVAILIGGYLTGHDVPTWLDAHVVARVDHFYTGIEVVTIEVNTTPGFSGASIFPKMLEVSGIGVAPAVNGLLDECVQRSR